MYKYVLLAGLIALGACNKSSVETPVTQPVMDYTTFNQEIPFGQAFYVDIDNNSSKDFLFYTIKAGDAALKKDYHYYQVSSSYGASVAVDTGNVQTPVLARNAVISASMPTGINWFNASGATLTRKVTGTAGMPFWEGGWKNANHQYVAVRVTRANANYYGWLELSFDADAGKAILHRSAICREAETEVKAGA